jgi:hypothetical protein
MLSKAMMYFPNIPAHVVKEVIIEIYVSFTRRIFNMIKKYLRRLYGVIRLRSMLIV